MLSQPRPRKPLPPPKPSDLDSTDEPLRTASFAAARTFVGRRLRRFTADQISADGSGSGRGGLAARRGGGGVPKSLSQGANMMEGGRAD
jgi:hypothetical protein